MRKLGIIVLVVLGLVVVAALALPYFLDVNRYRGRIQGELEKKLDRQVSLGPMDLKLFPLAIRIQNAVIGEDPAFRSNMPFAAAEELYVSVELMPLLRRDVQVRSIELRKPRIELIRNAQGVWNFASLGRQAASPPPPAAPPPAQAQQPQQEQAQKQEAQQKPQEFSVEDLQITDGQVAITDHQKRQTRAVYDHIFLAVEGFQPGKAFDVNVAAHLPGQGKQTIELDGRAGPIPDGSLITMPFDGSLKLEQVSVAAAQKFLNTQALENIEAVVSGDAKVKNEAGKVGSSGNLKIENARVRGTDIGYPITLDYDVADDLSTDVVTIAKGNLKLGGTPLALSGTLNTRPTPSQIDVKLNASNVSIQEAARLAAAFGVAFNPGMNIAGKMSADLTARGAANQPALNGTLSAQDLDISGKDLPKPVKVQGIQLALSPQTIRTNEFTASSGGTNLTVQATLNNYATPQSAVDASLRANNAELGELLAIAKAYGVSAAEGMQGSGPVTINVRATGPMKNASAMNFSGSGTLQNATLQPPQLTKPLQVKNANLRFTQNSVVIENFAGALGSTSANGTLTLRNFASPQVQFSLAADKMVVSEWQQMFKEQPQPAKTARSWSLVPSAWAQAATQPSLLSRMVGGGDLTVGTILHDQMVLNNAKAKVTLDHGVIRLDPITAELYGGVQTGTIVLDTRPTPSVYIVSSRMERVDANKLLSSTTSLKNRLYGLLMANANTNFVIPAGAGADQIARSLDGKLSLNLRDGKLQGMDLMNQLSTIGQFVGYKAPAKDFTSIAQLTGDFLINDGVATTNNLKAAIDGGTLAANGLVNLADQSLNLHVTAVLSKAMSEKVGGTGIGGLMSTALANRQGELVIPIRVTGTFSSPRFVPDLEKVAQMKLENLLPTAGNPGALTSGVLGAILGGKKDGADADAQPGGLEGILGAIGGQRQTQQPQPSEQPKTTDQTQQPQPRQANPLEDILGAISGQTQQKKKPAPQPQQQPQQQEQPPQQPE